MRLLRALVVVALMVGAGQCAYALTDAAVKPFDWPTDTTFEFAILGPDGTRFATAYYRVLKEESQGRTLYRFKYMARNDVMSESTECWIDPVTMLPVRSVRKLVEPQGVTYQDIAYSNGLIIVRRKMNDGQVQERDVPAPPGACYDYESLYWLIPQLDYSADSQLMLSMFSMVNEQVAHLIATDLGTRQLTLGNHTYDAHAYNLRYGLAPYTYYTVMQDGLAVPARIEMGKNTFVNIKIDPAKVKLAKPGAKDAAKSEADKDKVKPKGKAKAKPKATAKDKAKDKDENKDQPAEPGAGPLGPPPPGHTY